MKILPPKSVLILGLAASLAASSSSPLPAAPDSPYEIALLGRTLDPPAGVDRAMLETAFSRAAGREKAHFLVQLHEIPGAAERAELGRRGVELGGYVAGGAFMASVPAGAIRSLADVPELRWAMPWTAEHKVHPRMKSGDFGEWTRDRDRPEWVMLFVLLHHDVPLERIHGIAESAGGIAMSPLEDLHGATVWVPEGRWPALAESEDVLWIEEGPMPLGPTNDGVRAATRSYAVQAPPYALDGSGVKLFVYDAGTVRPTHEAFDAGAGSRVTNLDGQPVTDHATHVAGTAAGDGSGSPWGIGRGIADGATILSAAYQQVVSGMAFWENAGDIAADYALARQTYKADLGTNSIGSKTAHFGYSCDREGDYGVAAALIDQIVQGGALPGMRHPMILTWSAGNERTASTPKARCGANYATTAPPSCAKNPIHVGAVNSDGLSMTDFSSWGPCDDGRLKPTVVAPGCEQGRVHGQTFVYSALAGSDSQYGGPGFCGTSMSTPAVAGIVALFLEDWRALAGSATARPLPSLVKAFLIHTARDLGSRGPDYIYGYGAVDAWALIDTLRAGTGSLAASDAPAVWGEDEIGHGEVDHWRYFVNPGTAELKASLAWDDAAAAAFAAGSPVNDLTLQLIGPGGVVHDAFVLAPGTPEAEATKGLNALDNQEQVIVENPAPGRWYVRVKGASVPAGPQTYGVVYTQEAATHDPATCVAASAGFEGGDDLFTLAGATRAAAPAPGHGDFSLKVGGTAATIHEAYRDFAIPASATRAVLSYHVFVSSLEQASFPGYGWDTLTAEVRNTGGYVLAVVDNRNDGWKQGVWTRQFEVDLTGWKGSTVRIAYRAANDPERPTTFFIDDLKLETCGP